MGHYAVKWEQELLHGMPGAPTSPPPPRRLGNVVGVACSRLGLPSAALTSDQVDHPSARRATFTVCVHTCLLVTPHVCAHVCACVCVSGHV